MSRANSSHNDVLRLQQIDAICNAFEAEFQAGRVPCAAQVADDSDSALRAALLPELVRLELHYRPEKPHNELLQRFSREEQSWLSESLPELSRQEPAFPVIPGYLLTEELGRGGMGVIYLAMDQNLHRKVAVKMMLPFGTASTEQRARFLGEARAAARLRHPNLIQVFDSGEVEGQPFLVLEFIDGGTLANRIRDQRLSFSESAALIETLCHAVQYAHDHRIIHRDLKPSNILIDKGGVPRISDFGLAKCLDDDSRQTKSGMLVGTPSYMCPEQAAGLASASGPSVDLYSLGAILYELLTGRPPFLGASVLETLEQVRSQEPESLRAIDRSVPKDLETICLRCLEKDPARRYMSAQMMADELARFRRGESILARRPQAPERVLRWCRRYPLSAALMGCLILVMVVAVGLISWQWNEAVHQRVLAELNAVKFRAQRDRAVRATDAAETAAADSDRHRIEADHHRQSAESRFRKAQAPIRELIRLGTELVRLPHMEQRGREALRQASLYRKSLLEEKSSDPDTMREMSETLSTLGWTLLEFDELPEAEATLQQSLQILRVLHEREPENLIYLRSLVPVLRNLGVCQFNQRRAADAAESGRQSVQFAEQLVAANPENAWDRDQLANALTNLSAFLPSSRESRELLQKAVDTHRSVTAQHPQQIGFQNNLALALTNLASQLRGSDKHAAERLAIESAAIRRTQAMNAGVSRDQVMYLAASLNLLAGWYASDGRLEEADSLSKEATEACRRGLSDFPGYSALRVQYLRSLAVTLRLAEIRKDSQAALVVLERLCADTEKAATDFPDREEFRQMHASYRLRHGILTANLFHQPAVLQPVSLQPIAQSAAAMQSASPQSLFPRENDNRTRVEGMTQAISALHELEQLQLRSSTPELYRSNISRGALDVLNVGGRFEFEFEKLEAAKVWQRQQPENADAHNVVAWRQVCVADTSLRNAVAAEAAVREAIRLAPGRAFYHNTLGTALYYQDRLDDAAVELQKSLDLQTSEPAADHYFLAMIFHRRNQPKDASRHFAEAHTWHLEHGLNNAELNEILAEVRHTNGLPEAGE